MKRLIDILLVAAVIAGAVWTYQIKHEADLSAKRVRSLKAQIAAQERKIHLLEADWAIETAPARLEALAQRFEAQLGLKPLESYQIVTLGELPDMEPVEETPVETFAGAPGDEATDDTVTGGIGALIERESQ